MDKLRKIKIVQWSSMVCDYVEVCEVEVYDSEIERTAEIFFGSWNDHLKGKNKNMIINYEKIKEQLQNEKYEKMEGILDYLKSFNTFSNKPRYIIKYKQAKRKYTNITSCDLGSMGLSTVIGLKNAYKYSQQELAEITAIRKINKNELQFIDAENNEEVTIVPSIKEYFISFGYEVGRADHLEEYQKYLKQREEKCPDPDFEKTYISYGGGMFHPSYYACRTFLYKKNTFIITWILWFNVIEERRRKSCLKKIYVIIIIKF